MPGVSVVIPCYRCADTVGRAVGSALGQTLAPAEVILVDDASGDGTRAVLAALARENPAVRVIELPENRGPASARNAGWEASRGELVAFLDADDAWHPRKLEIQSRIMQEHPGLALTAHHNGTPSETSGFTELGLRALLFGRRLVCSSVMLRRSLAQRFPDGERYAEDFLLWLQIAAAGHRLARLEARLSARFEPGFGGAGLSGNLWPMEKAELRAVRRLWQQGAIGAVELGAAMAWSLARYARRLALGAA